MVAMPDSAADRENVRTTRRMKWLWFLLLMVAAIPLLWFLPLAAYLLSFI
jgi:hypothetical protein